MTNEIFPNLAVAPFTNINFNPSMDKQPHAQCGMKFTYPFLNFNSCNCRSLGMDQ